MKTQNPLVKDTFKQRFYEWICKKFGHVTVGSYYGMPQAWCGRCGRRNDNIAADGVPKWSIPDYLDKKKNDNNKKHS